MKPDEVEIDKIKMAIKRLVQVFGYSHYDIENVMADILNQIKK